MGSRPLLPMCSETYRAGSDGTDECRGALSSSAARERTEARNPPNNLESAVGWQPRAVRAGSRTALSLVLARVASRAGSAIGPAKTCVAGAVENGLALTLRAGITGTGMAGGGDSESVGRARATERGHTQSGAQVHLLPGPSACPWWDHFAADIAENVDCVVQVQVVPPAGCHPDRAVILPWVALEPIVGLSRRPSSVLEG
eukprot:1669937-Rhodomonas_salina.1